MTANRFYQRQLPLIIYGKFESVSSSKDFSDFALGICKFSSLVIYISINALNVWSEYSVYSLIVLTDFPELLTKTIMEYYEKNGTYIQKFSYPANVNTTFHEVPFTLGERYQQQVKGKWLMEYTYLAYEGDRTSLRTVFVEKRTAATPKNTPSWGEFAVTRDFTQNGYVSVSCISSIGKYINELYF